MHTSLRFIVHILCLIYTCWASAAAPADTLINHPLQWYATPEARTIADTILSYQTSHGDFPKNVDTTSRPYHGNPADLEGTFDNGATTTELRYLARMATVTSDATYTAAFTKGLDHILSAQYANGGWPQSAPPPGNYPRHITFNDDCMIRLLRFVRDVATDDTVYAFVHPARRTRCQQAWEKGIDCILNCQIISNGTLTVWCAQHDEVTLAPAAARAYELPSFSGGESAGITLLLMEIENPSDRVKQAVYHAAAWYEQHKLTGIREERKPDPHSPKGYDAMVVADPSAPPLWGRFYDLDTGKPYFCGRDGIKKPNLADIELERRAGYAWLRPWGKPLLDAYPAWAAKNSMPANLQ